MQWSKKAKELMRNECTGKIYTGEKRRKKETLEKQGKKRNTISYGNKRFLWGAKISFLISYLFPSFSKNTHTFPLSKLPLFSPLNAGYVLKSCFLESRLDLQPSSNSLKLKQKEAVINDRLFKSKIDLLFSFLSNFQAKRKIKKLSLGRWSA